MPKRSVDQAIQALVKAGILTPPSSSETTVSISKTERRKLADAMAKGMKRPLSEMVIEDRGQY